MPSLSRHRLGRWQITTMGCRHSLMWSALPCDSIEHCGPRRRRRSVSLACDSCKVLLQVWRLAFRTLLANLDVDEVVGTWRRKARSWPREPDCNMSTGHGREPGPTRDRTRLGSGRLPASRDKRDLFPVPHSRLDAASCPRRGRVAAGLQGQLDEACASLNWLAGGEGTIPPTPMRMDTIARVDGLINLK